MLQGLRTVIYGTDNLGEAKSWYIQVLGIQPYFDQPFYVGFNVGGYELGLDPNSPVGNGTASTGPLSYWGVANADQAFGRLLQLGATVHRPVQDVGDNIRLGTVIDPSGNILGIIQNPNFSLQ